MSLFVCLSFSCNITPPSSCISFCYLSIGRLGKKFRVLKHRRRKGKKKTTSQFNNSVQFECKIMCCCCCCCCVCVCVAFGRETFPRVSGAESELRGRLTAHAVASAHTVWSAWAVLVLALVLVDLRLHNLFGGKATGLWSSRFGQGSLSLVLDQGCAWCRSSRGTSYGCHWRGLVRGYALVHCRFQLPSGSSVD